MKEALERFTGIGSQVVDHKPNSLRDNRNFECPISNMRNAEITTIAPKARMNGNANKFKIQTKNCTAKRDHKMETLRTRGRGDRGGERRSDLVCEVQTRGEVQDGGETQRIHLSERSSGITEEWKGRSENRLGSRRRGG
jgi:hypothetical protein